MPHSAWASMAEPLSPPRESGGDPLRARLSSLLRERGSALLVPSPVAAQPVAEASPSSVADSNPSDEWAERIDALRRAQRIRDGRRQLAERSLPGSELAPGIRLIEARVPLPDADLSTPHWESEDHAPTRPLLYLDTETTGLAGGTGTLVFLLGLAWHEGDLLRVQQWLLTSPAAEAEWYARIAAAVPADPLLVSFNGKSFDLPLLATRHRLTRRSDPFAGRPHWDLMHPLRRAFDRRWPDCRLQTAERRLLGLQRIDDLPGAFAPQAFTAFLRHGETGMLTEAIRHNRDDVIALARLLPALRTVFDDPARFDADASAIARRLIAVGRVDAAQRILQAAANEPQACHALATLHARARRWNEVERLLAPLTDGASPCAMALERLAKIAEHVHRQPHRALELATRLSSLEPSAPRHHRRIARLQRSLANT
jgi:uncharacterized protein YprB with RNaseH-like and TPR domain